MIDNRRTQLDIPTDSETVEFVLWFNLAIQDRVRQFELKGFDFVDGTPTLVYRTRQTTTSGVAKEIRELAVSIIAAYRKNAGGPPRVDVHALPPTEADGTTGARWSLERDVALRYSRDELTDEKAQEGLDAVADGLEFVDESELTSLSNW